MMARLHITQLRPGADGNHPDAPNAAAVGPIVCWTRPARSSAAIGSGLIIDIERDPLADKLTAGGTAATPGPQPADAGGRTSIASGS